MSPILAMLLLAVLFTAFALLTRRVEPRSCSTHACPDPTDSERAGSQHAGDACAGCELAAVKTETNDHA